MSDNNSIASASTENKMLETLRTAVDENAKLVRTIYVAFLGYCLYVAVLTGSTTHEQLLRDKAPNIPFVDIELPMTGIYFVVPILLVLFHFDLLLQMKFLARAAWQFKERLDQDDALSAEDRVDHLDAVNSSPFVYMLIGDQYRPKDRILMRVMIVASVFIAPPILLMLIQISFLPFHHHFIHYLHQALIAVDLFVLLFFWPGYSAELNPQRERAQIIRSYAMPVLFVCIVMWFIGFGPARPYGFLDSWADPAHMVAKQNGISHENACYSGTIATVEREAVIKRVLTIRDRNLTHSEPSDSADQLKRRSLTKGLDLSGRDLRGADFQKSDFTNVNLEDARLDFANFLWGNLQGGKLNRAEFRFSCLSGVTFSGAEFNVVKIVSSDVGLSFMDGASFVSADLSNSNFAGAFMRGSNFDEMTSIGLENSVFSSAYMDGALIAVYGLNGVKFSKTRLGGSEILIADKIKNTDFSGAKLDFADMRETETCLQADHDATALPSKVCQNAVEMKAEATAKYYQDLFKYLKDRAICVSASATENILRVKAEFNQVSDEEQIVAMMNFTGPLYSLISTASEENCRGAYEFRTKRREEFETLRYAYQVKYGELAR